MAYTINPLTKPAHGGVFHRNLIAEPEPALLFPGVLIKHTGGVVVFIQHLSPSLRCKAAFEHTLSSESAELVRLCTSQLPSPRGDFCILCIQQPKLISVLGAWLTRLLTRDD